MPARRALPPIRTLTVGPGISPGQPAAGSGRVADCNRRFGLSPTPECAASGTRPVCHAGQGSIQVKGVGWLTDSAAGLLNRPLPAGSYGLVLFGSPRGHPWTGPAVVTTALAHRRATQCRAAAQVGSGSGRASSASVRGCRSPSACEFVAGRAVPRAPGWGRSPRAETLRARARARRGCCGSDSGDRQGAERARKLRAGGQLPLGPPCTAGKTRVTANGRAGQGHWRITRTTRPENRPVRLARRA